MEKVKGLYILKMRVQESFMQGEGISTLRACHKGRQPLIECANHDFNIYLFSLLSLFSHFKFFCVFSLFMFFFIFLESTRVFPSLLHIPQLQ